jgi:hypothetical protein
MNPPTSSSDTTLDWIIGIATAVAAVGTVGAVVLALWLQV